MNAPSTPSPTVVWTPQLDRPMCHILPLELQHVVAEMRQKTQADDAIIINSMLSVMSIAVQALADILNPFTGNPIPLSLYFITVADTGARKSAVDDIFMAPIRQFEETQGIDNELISINCELEKEIFDARHRALISRLNKATNSGNKGDEQKFKSELLTLKNNKPIAAPEVRILVSDATQPALLKALGKPWNKLCLSNVDAGKNLNGKEFSTPSFYNMLWDATPQSIERIKRGSQQARDYRFSMNLRLQPFYFSKYIRLHGDDAKESGFFPRCLFSFPPPLHPIIQTPTIEKFKTPNIDKFITRITALLNIANQKFQHGQIDERNLLPLQNNAIILNFEKENERIKTYLREAQFIQRATEHALRLAGVMHVFLSDDDDTIVKDDILWAACHMTYDFASRYQQAITYNELSEQILNELLDFINRRASRIPSLNVYAVTKSLLLQCGPSRLKKKEPLDAALSILESSRKIWIRRMHSTCYIIPVNFDYYSGFPFPSPNQPPPTWGQP